MRLGRWGGFAGLASLLAVLLLFSEPIKAQEPLPSVADAPQVEIESILERLERQEEELRRLRALVDEYAKPSTAAAEPAVDPSPGNEVGSDKQLNAAWNNGVEFKNQAGDYRIHIGGSANFDVNEFHNDPWLEAPRAVGGIGPNPDSMQLRRGRITMDGTFYEVFGFKTEFEFANFLTRADPTTQSPVANSPGFTDFYLWWKELPIFGNIRVGNQKEPLGMEHLMSYKFTDFMERSYLQDVVFGPFNNGFNPGILAFDATADQKMTWAVGAFGNNSNPWAYSVGNDWAFTGRTTYLLFYDAPSEGRYLWEIGASGSVRKPDEELVRLRARGNIRSGPPGALNPIYADTRLMEADRQQILALETAAQWGPWSLEAEYTGTWVQNAVQPFTPEADRVARGSPYFHGGYVSLMYFLTGEHRTYNRQLAVFDRVIPYENFFCVNTPDGRCCGWGAWQIGARYSALDLNDNGINGGMLHSGTFGVNWFMTPNAKVMFNFDVTHRGQVREVDPGKIYGFGTRIAFDF